MPSTIVVSDALRMSLTATPARHASTKNTAPASIEPAASSRRCTGPEERAVKKSTIR